MKDIKVVKLEKYSSEDYINVGFDIYFNKKSKNFCFCFEADKVEQYPLEDLLDQYKVNCTEYYGDPVTINGEEKNVVEVETLSAKRNDLIAILNFSTILDKEIISVSYNGKELLTLKYGDTNVKVNGKAINVPIVAYRNDINGMVSFGIKYPEMQYKGMFTDGRELSFDIDNFDENNIKYVLLRDGKAKIIYEDNDTNNLIEIVYNLKGLETIVK